MSSDILSGSHNPPVNKDIDDRTYELAVNNFNVFDPCHFASYSLDEITFSNELKPDIQCVNISSNADKNFKELEFIRIETGNVGVKGLIMFCWWGVICFIIYQIQTMNTPCDYISKIIFV